MAEAGAATGPFQRHFLALRPDAAARDALAALPLPSGARAVHPRDLHLTLAFLGTLDADGEGAALTVAAMAAGSPEARAARVELHVLEYWRGAEVLCATTGEGDRAGGLGHLAAVIARGLADVGLRIEARPFRAHVTLARRAPRGTAPRSALLRPVAWHPRAIVLMARRAAPTTRTSPGGGAPAYEVRGEVQISTNTTD